MGSNHEFKGLYKSLYDDLYQFALSFTGTPEVAEDLVHDVFLNTWRNEKEWNSRAHARAYLLSAVRNRAINHLNMHRLARRAGESWREEGAYLDRQHAKGPSPDEVASGEEFRQGVREAVSRLPKRQRETFRLSRHHGLSYAEIAEVLDISVKTVETHMVRALDTLREELRAFL